MPTYEYECQSCHERIEAVQKFTDAPLSTCSVCAGPLRKVFSAVGIVFKGSGFYKNDSRSTSSSAAPSPASTATPSAATTPAVPVSTPGTATKTETSSSPVTTSAD